jgi:hypothetical protein
MRHNQLIMVLRMKDKIDIVRRAKERTTTNQMKSNRNDQDDARAARPRAAAQRSKLYPQADYKKTSYRGP